MDLNESPGQYFLSGSQNLTVLRSAAESMAGRVGVLNLAAMTPYEMFGNAYGAWLEHYLGSPGAISP